MIMSPPGIRIAPLPITEAPCYNCLMNDLVVGLLFWGGGLALALAFLYWRIIVGEGTYLGPYAVQLIYQLGARHYDAVRAFPSLADQQQLLPLLRTALKGRSRPQVLDVATGTGRVPLLLAADGWDGPLVGLDLTAAMLEQARAKHMLTCPEAAITWQLGEAGQLRWPDGTFDLVTCLEALEFFPRPRRAIIEMARVLMPGGNLVLSKYPDGWARALPGKALTRVAMKEQLARLGLVEIVFHPWQPGHYELVIARKQES